MESGNNLVGNATRKDTAKYEIKDIKALPEGWALLSTSEKDEDKDAYLTIEQTVDENLAKEFAIIKIPIEDKKSPNSRIIVFITTRSTFANNKVKDLQKEYKDKNEIIYTSIVNEELIKEIYKFAKDAENNKEKDYSKSKGVQKEIHDLIADAQKSGVSDIHIEVRRGFTLIKGRINGKISLFKKTAIAETTGFEYGRVIYQTMTKVSQKTFNEKNQQDALVEGIFGGIRLRIRVAVSPTEPSGFDMVMRLLVIQNHKEPKTLEQLGYQYSQRTLIKHGTSQPTGLTLISGTTGSGKSTTLQNVLLDKINQRNGEIKVITVEDPPEYFIPGATQVPVIRDATGDAKQAFEKAIKTAMRSDPDVIMIGEIRDNQSAKLMVEAVQSGHQVLSTLHASSALGAIYRLENLEVGRDILGAKDFFSVSIYQKLLPIICPHCAIKLKEDFIPSKYPIELIIMNSNLGITDKNIFQAKKYGGNIVRQLQNMGLLNVLQAEIIFNKYKELNNEEELEEFYKRIVSVTENINDSNIVFQGEGCTHCKGTGVIGRTVVSEVFKPDIECLNLISSKEDGQLVTYWRKNLNGKYAAEDAYDKMIKGIVSPLDVEHDLGLIGSQII